MLRSIRKGGRIGEGLSDWAIWSVVEQAAKQIGIERFAAAATSSAAEAAAKGEEASSEASSPFVRFRIT
ncbi:MAG: hypothetical protein ACYDHN_07265 [Solirubrobacteraceae bacterium]